MQSVFFSKSIIGVFGIQSKGEMYDWGSKADWWCSGFSDFYFPVPGKIGNAVCDKQWIAKEKNPAYLHKKIFHCR